MLTNEQQRAISSFNTEKGLLEDVMKHLSEQYFNEWLHSKEDHSKQREALYLKTLVLDDVAKVIRQSTNKQLFD